MTLALVDRIRALPRERRRALYRALPPGTLASQRFSPAFWARPEQTLPPRGQLATIEVLRGGRGAGKTLAAVWAFNAAVEAGERWPRVVAATQKDLVKVVIDGPSGLRTWLPPHRKPEWTGSRDGGTLTYPNGRSVVCGTAHEPGDAIGQGCSLTLADDPAKWVEKCGERRARETFLQLRISNREGPRPVMLVPTTLLGLNFLKRILERGGAGMNVRKLKSAHANTSLSASYIRDTIGDLEDGGDWAAEELLDEDRDEAPGAMWKRGWINATRCDAIRDGTRVVAVIYRGMRVELTRIVVAVDPADSGKLHSDETGIVVVGMGEDGRLYVLADYTGHWEAEHWAAIAAWAFRTYGAGAVAAETNRARSTVRRCMAIELPNAPVIEVDAMQGKDARAEPLTLLYRDGQVSHVSDGAQLSRAEPVELLVPVWDPVTERRVDTPLTVRRDRRRWGTLEDEICGWVPGESRSPNGLDALVMACAHLRPPDGSGPWEPLTPGPSRFGAADPRAPIALAADPRRLTRIQERRLGR